MAVLQVLLQAVAPAAAKVEAVDERDLPGDVQVVLSTRLITGFRTVVSAQSLEARRGRTSGAAAAPVAGV